MNLQRGFCARAISGINSTGNFSGSQGQFTPAFKGDCPACPGHMNLSFHGFLEVQFSGLPVHIK